jgi:hypothetical protein
MSGTLEDDYALLGLPVGSNADEISKAFRALSKRVHPDAGGSAGLFRELESAYRRILAGEHIDEQVQDDEPDGEPEAPIWGCDETSNASRVVRGAGRWPRWRKGVVVLLVIGFWLCHQILESTIPSLLRVVLSVSVALLVVSRLARVRGRQRA